MFSEKSGARKGKPLCDLPEPGTVYDDFGDRGRAKLRLSRGERAVPGPDGASPSTGEPERGTPDFCLEDPPPKTYPVSGAISAPPDSYNFPE